MIRRIASYILAVIALVLFWAHIVFLNDLIKHPNLITAILTISTLWYAGLGSAAAVVSAILHRSKIFGVAMSITGLVSLLMWLYIGLHNFSDLGDYVVLLPSVVVLAAGVVDILYK